MGRTFLRWLQSPGARADLQFFAQSPVTDHGGLKDSSLSGKEEQVVVETCVSYSPVIKSKRLDRWLDRVVGASGSESVYIAILLGLLVWAFLGIPYGSFSSYKIIISDVQAIVNLVFDAFLMRQQFNQHDNLLMRSSIQRAIDYYADLVGTLTGIVILVVVIVVWVVCGPALGFDANWWLLIGTYAGLVGLNDGFVLRNICQVLGDHEDEQFAKVMEEDLHVFAMTGMEAGDENCQVTYSFSHLIFIIALIAGASAMRWNETGQLLCNIPPSIIESFLTLVLITGHNLSEEKRRRDLADLYLHRLQLLAIILPGDNINDQNSPKEKM
ncbi:hypothetical protein ACEQ8H_005806 [Pleosporales sp. CAS-2024a]